MVPGLQHCSGGQGATNFGNGDISANTYQNTGPESVGDVGG